MLKKSELPAVKEVLYTGRGDDFLFKVADEKRIPHILDKYLESILFVESLDGLSDYFHPTTQTMQIFLQRSVILMDWQMTSTLVYWYWVMLEIWIEDLRQALEG